MCCFFWWSAWLLSWPKCTARAERKELIFISSHALTKKHNCSVYYCFIIVWRGLSISGAIFTLWRLRTHKTHTLSPTTFSAEFSCTILISSLTNMETDWQLYFVSSVILKSAKGTMNTKLCFYNLLRARKLERWKWGWIEQPQTHPESQVRANLNGNVVYKAISKLSLFPFFLNWANKWMWCSSPVDIYCIHITRKWCCLKSWVNHRNEKVYKFQKLHPIHNDLRLTIFQCEIWNQKRL